MNNAIKYFIAAFLGLVFSHFALAQGNNNSPMQMLATQAAPSSEKTTTKPEQIDSTSSQTNLPEEKAAEPMPAPAETSMSEPASQDPAEPAVIDCNYTVPDLISKMSADTIVQWANYAAVKTFTYDFQNYDKEFQQLKPCYTTVGWDSFVAAMKTSNNLKSTQEERLFVSAKINGQSQITAQSTGKDASAWIVRVPLKVTYQNQDREVTQDIYADLTIKTIYGSPVRLGVNQIVATPKTTHELS